VATVNDGGTRVGLLRRVGVWSLYATTLTPLVFSSGTIYPYVLPRAVYFRVLVAVAAAVALYLVVARPGGSGRAEARVVRDPVLAALGVLVTVQLVGAIAGASPARSLFGDMERMGGVLAWLHYLAFYLALRTLATERQFLSLFRILTGVVLCVGAIAILQSFGVRIGILPGTVQDRVVGTLGNSGYLAAYEMLGVGVAGLVALRSSGTVWRAGAGLSAVAAAVVVLLTLTRAGVAGLAFGAFVALVAYGAMTRSRRRAIALVTAALVVVLAGVGGWSLSERRGDGPARDPGAADASFLERGLGYRLSAWRAGLDAVEDAPLTGLGLENFRLAFDWHFDPERLPPHMHYTRAHNDLVESLVTGGIPGGLAWIALWAAVFYALVAATREARLGAAEAALLGGAFAAYLVYLLVWFQEQNTFPVFLALAAFVGTRRLGPRIPLRDAETPDRPPTVRAIVAVVLCGLVLADIAHHGRLLMAGGGLVRAAATRDLAARVDANERALEARPPGAEEVVTEFVRFATALPGSVGRALGDRGTRAAVERVLDRARDALGAQLEKDQLNPRLHRDAARLFVIRYQVGRETVELDSALAHFEQAIELAPGRLRYRHMASEALLMAGRPDAAVTVLEEGLARYDGLGETHYYLAKALLVRSSYLEAAEALTRTYQLGYINPSGAVHDVLARELRERGERAAVTRLAQARDAALRAR